MATEIVAEIGVCHNGDINNAIALIRAAKRAGADTAKFQLTVPELETSGLHAADHLAMIRSCRVDSIEFLVLCQAACREAGIGFLATPAEEVSMGRLVQIGVGRIKIGSDNLANPPFLRACAATGLPLVLSTGMASIHEVGRAVGMLGEAARRTTLLHCVSCYPCQTGDANLSRIGRLYLQFQLPIGFSDHTTSPMVPALAVAAGAKVIEKHITLDQGATGPDHRASMEPEGFAHMVRLIRMAEAALGTQLGPYRCEIGTAKVARKSLVAARAIAKGEVFGPDSLAIKRPGDGMPPWLYDQLLGRSASRHYRADEQIVEQVA